MGPASDSNEKTEKLKDHVLLGYKSPFPLVSGRDFVFYRDVFTEGSVTELYCINAPYKSNASFVRGTCIMAAWQMVPLDNGDLKVTFLQQSDFNGNIPLWMTKSTCLESILNVRNIVKILGKQIVL
ncbi:hypothetical protein AKO1_001149 [Acrasis kona]|uniref:START domain-containing protein n=1 Tax=Acrasis kona TaxID=1008807 RepID=A0AAW2ZBY2_9EUKA